MKLKDRSSPFLNPLCVALDVDSKEEALRLTEELGDLVGGFKLGPRLVNRYGEDLIGQIAQAAPVFVDCKFFDIVSTMESAIRAAFRAGASAATIHALSGTTALRRMAELQQELSAERPFRILAVTILTSWKPEDFPPTFSSSDAQVNVQGLADYCGSLGLHNFVCSPEELALVQKPDRYLVTPGIRFASDAVGDQSRVAEPQQAYQAGSNLLVVGRPIIQAPNPREAAADYLAELI